MSINMPSQDRILFAALGLFLEQGVRKTSLAEVAFRAGLTRVTVYRCFTNKRELVRAVCLHIAGIFARAAEGSRGSSIDEIEACLGRLGHELSELPRGNLLARLEEIHRLYPDVYEEFRSARQAANDRIFHEAIAAARREGALREGLNQDVLKAVFWSAVVNLIENPSLISANVPLAEVCATVTAVFRHGILKNDTG